MEWYLEGGCWRSVAGRGAGRRNGRRGRGQGPDVSEVRVEKGKEGGEGCSGLEGKGKEEDGEEGGGWGAP